MRGQDKWELESENCTSLSKEFHSPQIVPIRYYVTKTFFVFFFGSRSGEAQNALETYTIYRRNDEFKQDLNKLYNNFHNTFM